jgi:hypothetical protein
MNFAGNIVGIALPVAIGLIVSAKGSYYLALMVFAATGAGSVPVPCWHALPTYVIEA